MHSNSSNGHSRVISQFSLAALAAACCISASAAVAETMYVTDVLRLELTAEPQGSSETLRVLASGARLEVSETRPYYALVETEDGQRGWVKSGYLTAEKPAQARLQELQRERDSLASQVQSLQTNLSSQAEQLNTVAATRDVAEATVRQNENELATLRSENRELKDLVERFRFSIPLKWLLIISLATLIGGFAGGFAWLDWRHRARHGGFRI